MYRKVYLLSKTHVIIFFVFICIVCSVPALSDATDADLDDILDGFEDTAEVSADDSETEPSTEEYKPPMFSLDGYFKLSSSYNFAHDKPENGQTDWRGVSRLRSELQLELNANLPGSWKAYISGKGSYDAAYEIKGRDKFTSEVLDNYENELEFRQVYILGSLSDHLDIKAGRQTVVWGKSDNIRVTDVLNPLDTREFGLTDIEDLRLPVVMTRVDAYTGSWNLTGIAVHEIRFNKNAEYGSDFYPGASPPPPEDKPSNSIDNTEFAVAINGMFSGWDMALYWADIYNDAAHREVVAPGSPPQMELKHARLTMFGTALNVVKGNWLFKAETAHFDGVKFFNNAGQTYRRTDVLAGFEYSGFQDTTISIEAVNRYIHDFDAVLEQPPDNTTKDEFQSVGRISRTFWNQTLTLTLLASTFGVTGQDGALQRFSAEYDVNDAVQVNGGVVLYHSGDLAHFRTIGDSDRIYFEINYSF